MIGRIVGLIALAAIELLTALSLYNQSLATRAMITVHNRRAESIELRTSEVAAARAFFTSPTALNQRLAANSEIVVEL